MFVNYSDIAGHQNLFLDYMYEFENVEQFYLKNFRNYSVYPEIFQSLTHKPKAIRTEITNILKEQYANIRISHQTEINIESLNSTKTIAVVTGQQLGIFGGPLYTFYKIMTAIKLCSHFKNKFEGYNFVPVFWLEGDDHDFNEINHMSTLDPNNQVATIFYNDGNDEETNRGSVGNIALNENFNATLEEFYVNLKPTEFSEELKNIISDCYKTGESFKSAFRSLLHKIFDEYGLVLFDPQDVKVKKLLKPVFLKEIEDYRDHTKISVERSAQLEEIYHAQVKVKPVNLFYGDSTGRFLIEPDDHFFKLKNKKKKFTKDELTDLISSQPELFSPNVILRPICQDYLLPTGLYVAGPGEINYFAQVIPFYDVFNVVQPVIYPRASATILEKNTSGIVSKYNLSINNFFNTDNMLNQKVINSLSEVDIQKLFASVAENINESIESLRIPVTEIDKTLVDLLDKTKEKFEQQLFFINQKIDKAQERKHETIVRQLEKVKNSVFPENALQERVINFTYFANKYGINFFKWLINELAIDKFEHQVIEL